MTRAQVPQACWLAAGPARGPAPPRERRRAPVPGAPPLPHMHRSSRHRRGPDRLPRVRTRSQVRGLPASRRLPLRMQAPARAGPEWTRADPRTSCETVPAPRERAAAPARLRARTPVQVSARVQVAMQAPAAMRVRSPAREAQRWASEPGRRRTLQVAPVLQVPRRPCGTQRSANQRRKRPRRSRPRASRRARAS